MSETAIPEGMPEPDAGWRSRRARRRAERAWARDLDTMARERAAKQTSATRTEETMTWPLRILAALVAVVVLAVAAVIAVVVIGTQVGFYSQNLKVKSVDIGQLHVDLTLFTPIATESIVWSCTLMAVVMVMLSRTSALWTRAMWLFAWIAAAVNAWHAITEDHDFSGGLVKGGLSVGGPIVVHLFILWCKHLRTGRSLAQARIDSDIRWQAIGRHACSVLIALGRHLRHPTIALSALGYRLGVDGWTYQEAWRAASVGYRRRVRARIDGTYVGPFGRWLAACRPAAETTPPAAVPDTADACRPGDDAFAPEDMPAGGVLTAERPAFDETEIDHFRAVLDAPGITWELFADQREQAAEGGGRGAAGPGQVKRPAPRPAAAEQAAQAAGGGGRKAAGSPPGTRPVQRPKLRWAGGSKTADVDISDLLPAARKVAADLGNQLTRDLLLNGLRARNLSVGGRRKKAIYDAINAERNQESTGQ